MKKIIALGALGAAIVVLVFASIALAQSSPDQSSADQTSSDQTSPEPAQTPDPSTQAAPTQDALTVNIHDHAFDPAQLDVAPGTNVTWVNGDTEPHTVTADDGLFDSGTLNPGESYTVWLDGSGTVPYHCEIHPDMQGSLLVGGASGGEAPTTEAPATEAPASTPEQTTQESQAPVY